MQAKVSRANQQRVDAIIAHVRRLPRLEQQLWASRLKAKIRSAPALRAAVGDSGEYGTVQPPPSVQTEWDLQLANWLDGVYTVVADRAEEVHAKAVEKVTETTSAVGFSVLPLALAAAVVLLALGYSKRTA